MHCARSHSHRLTLDQYIVLNKVSTLPVIWTFTMKHVCSTSNLSQIISATCIHFRRILACVQTHPQKAAAFGRLKSPWTTRLVVCRFGHVCGHPLNRRWSDLQFDSKRLQQCVCAGQIVQCTTYSYKKSYKMWRVFLHAYMFPWNLNFASFCTQDHGPCHAVDCIDKTVRVRNDAEAVERMLGQATIFMSFHVEGLNQWRKRKCRVSKLSMLGCVPTNDQP